jgi:hypothetical protein
LKHYFQPSRGEFRRTLQKAMPKLLSNGQDSPSQTPREQILDICKNAAKKRGDKMPREFLSLSSSSDLGGVFRGLARRFNECAITRP